MCRIEVCYKLKCMILECHGILLIWSNGYFSGGGGCMGGLETTCFSGFDNVGSTKIVTNEN